MEIEKQSRLELRLKDINHKIRRTTLSFIDAENQSTKSLLEDTLQSLQEESKEIHKQISEATSFSEFYEPLADEIVDKLQNPSQTWEELGIKNKIMFQKWIFPEGMSIAPDLELRTSTICLTYSVIGGSKSNKSKMVELMRQNANQIIQMFFRT